MSLLDSIFGEKLQDENDLSSLFCKKELPIPGTSKKKRSLSTEEDDDDDDDDDKNNNNSAKLRKTKEKTKEDNVHESDNNSSSNSQSSDGNADDSDDDSEEQDQKDNNDEDDGDSDGGQPEQKATTTAIDMKKKKDEKELSSQRADPNLENQSATEKQSKTLGLSDVKETGDGHDEDDDDDVNARTIFVGNLPNSFTRKGLEKLFRDYGAIESTRIRSVATTGVKVPQAFAGNQNLVKKVSVNLHKVDVQAKPSIVGYVVFTNSDSADKALQMNNASVPDPTGTTPLGDRRRIRVTTCVQSEFDSARSIFVGNLPYKTDEGTLRGHFCQGCDISDTDIEGVRVVRDKESYQCKGFAYILFKDRTLVATALRQMHNSTYMNRSLRVLVCSRRYKSNPRTEGRPRKKKQKKIATALEDPNMKPGVAALRRILEKEGESSQYKNKRVRGKNTSHKPTAKKSGVSRRVAAEAKANKRVKKLQKRISKGMGKAKQGG